MDLFLFLLSLIALIVAFVSSRRSTALQEELDVLRREFGDIQRRFNQLIKKETPVEPKESVVKQKRALVSATEKENEEELIQEEPLQTGEAKGEEPEFSPVVEKKIRPVESNVVTPSEPDLVQRFFSKLSELVKTYGPQAQEGEPKEVVLMRWWLPRLGGALALLTLLFLGLYMGRFSSPWMRACELIGGSLGFCAVGLFFESRRKAFGSVLFVTGLIMLCLTSFAIYAFPAVRIVHNPILGTILQLLAMALICGVGLIRQKNALICLGYVFGVLIIVFMQYEMLPGGALFMSLVLAASAFILWGLHQRLSFLVYVAQFVLLIAQIGTLGFFFLRTQTVLGSLCLISALSASLIVPLLSQVISFREILGRKYFIPFCKASGAGLGYLLIRYMCPDLMLLYYGVLALSFIGLGISCFRRDGFKESTQWYLVMGSLFCALWVMNYFAGDIRWYALILESLVIALIYRKHPCWVNAVVMYALWVCSTFIFCSSFFDGTLRSDTWFVAWIYIYLLYPIFQIMVPMVAYGRNPRHKIRAGIISGVIGVFSGIFFMGLLVDILPSYEHSDIWFLIGSAYLFGALILIPWLNRAAPIAASISLYIFSLISHTSEFAYDLALVPIWGWAILAVYANLKSQKPLKLWSFAAYGSSILVTAYTLLVYHSVDENALMYSMVLALICLGLSRVKLFSPLGLLSLIFPLFAIVEVVEVFVDRPHLEFLGLACHMIAILLMIVWLLLAKSKLFTETLASSVGGLPKEWIIFPSILLGSLYYLTPMDWYHWWVLQIFTLASLGFFAFSSERNQDRLMLLPFYLVALLQVVSSLAYSWLSDLFYVIPGAHFLLFELIFAALYFSYGILVGRSQKWESSDAPIHQGALSLSAYVVGTAIIFYPTLPLAGIYTPLLGALSVLFVVVGVFCKIRVYRLLGLITLIIPGYRLFAYDITDALYRILAFGIGALLLIFIGYLYHRMVVPDEDTAE